MSGTAALRILLVDDSPEAASYVARSLAADLPAVAVRRVPDRSELLAALADDEYDLVITEAHLSWTSGLEVLRTVRERRPEPPVLMLTSQGDDALAASALQAGFDAFLHKASEPGGRLAAAVRAALAAARERSARRRAEEALGASEARHRAIVEAAPDTIVTIDEHGQIESVNPAVRRMFGYEPEELVGQNVAVLMPDEIGVAHESFVQRYLDTGEARIIGTGRVVEARRKDGTSFPVDLAVGEARLTGRRLFSGIIRDLSAQRRAEEERLASLERERAAMAAARREATEKTLILENMLDAVFVTDREGRFVHVNPAACRLLGMTADQLLGIGLATQPWQTCDENGLPLAHDQRPIVRALRGERVSQHQRVKMTDGRELILRTTTSPMLDEHGEIVGVVHVAHDMTEDYARARQAAEGAKLRSLGQLAGGVAHDLNQYLGLVVGYGDLAMAALDRPNVDLEAVRDSLSTMIRAAVDGAEGVRRLLLFARPGEAGPAGRVDLEDVLREVAKLTAPRWRDAAQQQGRPIALELEIEGETAIDGWAADLREAFANLVLNAVDALPRGGTIRLSARQEGDRVVAEVADDGVGMTAETRERLFEPFFSTKGDSGSGLGLPIVLGIVQRHGGALTVESAPGEGTTFRLTFPTAAGTEAPGPSPPELAIARPLSILVVDDEPALATMLARLLASDGHEVAVAGSGEEALSLLAGAPFDAVISDLGMGAGMNGWDLAAAVRALPSPPAFILTTGWGAEIDLDEATKRGVLAVVSKPYRLPDIRKVLSAL